MEPAVITKIRLAVTLIVNSSNISRLRCELGGFSVAIFVASPMGFLAQNCERKGERVSSWKSRPAGDNGIGHDSVAAKRETIY